MKSTSRPLGGISALKLGVASSLEAAPSLETDSYEIDLLEDRSTYSETVSYIGQCRSVIHSLSVVTRIDYNLPKELLDALTKGFVAHIMHQSRCAICVGWSPDAAADRPLRLISCSTVSGDKPSSRGYKEWLFESTDSVMNI